MLISNDDYEYRGLMAEMWDLLRGDTSQWEDRFFYLECVRLYGQPVLDVGCGTGRILLDFLNQGIDIDGVDNSPEMLELLRRKAAQANLQPRIYQQVMEGLSLTRNYQLILVPSSSFQLLLEPEKPAQALHRFYEHLYPAGGWLCHSWTYGSWITRNCRPPTSQAGHGRKYANRTRLSSAAHPAPRQLPRPRPSPC